MFSGRHLSAHKPSGYDSGNRKSSHRLIKPLFTGSKICENNRKYFLLYNVIRYILYGRPMIKSFRCKETEKIFARQYSRKLPRSIQSVALRKLRMLHNSMVLNDLKVPPDNRLEALSGKRAGQYSIRINEQWRICFEWLDNNAINVEIVDYH